MVKEALPEEIIEEITSKCYDSHKELITTANHAHLKTVKRAINVRVGLPVAVLSALLMWLIQTNYSIGVATAAHRTMTDQTIETQTMTIGAEIRTRELNEEQIKAEIKRLEIKLDANFKWLIENGTFKSRGESPLLK